MLSANRIGRLVIAALPVLACPGPGLVAAQTVTQLPTPVAAARMIASDEFPDADGSIWLQQKRGQTPRYIEARLAAGRPGLDLVELAWQADRLELGVKLLLAYIHVRPDDDDHTLELLWRTVGRFKRRQFRPQFKRILGAVAIIRRRLASNPRARAARIAWQLLRVQDAIGPYPLQPKITGVRRDAFIKRWAGTDASQFADIERRLSPPVTEQAVDGMEQFARAHRGTSAGAKAWAELAIVLGSGEIPIAGNTKRDLDPTERYLRLQAAVRALQEQHDPSDEWVQRAPALGSRFWMPGAVFGPGGADRLLAAYRDFLITQLSSIRSDVEASGVAYHARSTMPSLLSATGDSAAAMERLFDDVERAVPDKTVVRYLRGRYYLHWSGTAEHPNPAMRQRARMTLVAVANETSGRYPRLALAALAGQLFTQGDYSLARTEFLTYVSRYPEGDWAWVAALHAGQCSEQLQEWARAIDEYHQAADGYASNPLARVLGLTYAARVGDALGAHKQALVDYRAARKVWDPDYGQSYTTGDPYSKDDSWRVTPGLLDGRIDQLSRARR